jgi:hypothetical protein
MRVEGLDYTQAQPYSKLQEFADDGISFIARKQILRSWSILRIKKGMTIVRMLPMQLKKWDSLLIQAFYCRYGEKQDFYRLTDYFKGIIDKMAELQYKWNVGVYGNYSVVKHVHDECGISFI